MKTEFREGPGSCDPWTLEENPGLIVTSDIAYWVRINDLYSVKCLSDTESRIKGGEDPEKVIMDSLEFWRPKMIFRKKVLSRNIEIGVGSIDPKTWWTLMSRGEEIPEEKNKGKYRWIYIGEDPVPIRIDTEFYVGFLEDLKRVRTEEDLEFLITTWTWK